MAREYDGTDFVIGAGTVMDPETARMAILSGAQYVVSPYFNGDTVRLCNRYRVACMPGAMSIAEVVAGMEAVSYTHLDVYKRQACGNEL